MSEAAPAFSFYAKDFMMGTVTMSLAERGAYITLLAYQWDNGSVPGDPPALARIWGCPQHHVVKLWTAVKVKFQQGKDGLFRNARLELERQKQADRRAVQAANGKKGGRPGNNPTETHGLAEVKANGNPNESPGLANPRKTLPSSFPDPDPKKEKEEKHARARVSLSPPADPFMDDEITERAGRFIEKYQELYPRHRFGARYAVKPHRDYQAAVSLCQTWPDDARLEKLAVCFLTTDHKFAAEGSRTLTQFLALASWADGELSRWEREHS